jgi:DNA-binding NarL/FixJ family response regulator
MPVMNGLDAARALIDLMPSVPIIMFTLQIDTFVKEEARSAGVADVISKSEDISVLTPATLRNHFFSQSGQPSLSLLRTRRFAAAFRWPDARRDGQLFSI